MENQENKTKQTRNRACKGQMTVVTWKSAGKEAIVMTDDKTLIPHLLMKVDAYPQEYKLDYVGEDGTHVFLVSTKQIAFRNPVSDARREAGRKNRMKRRDMTALED